MICFRKSEIKILAQSSMKMRNFQISKLFRNINLVLDNDAKAVNLTTFIKSTFEQRIHIDIQAKYTTNIQEKIETIDLKNVEIKGILNAIS